MKQILTYIQQHLSLRLGLLMLLAVGSVFGLSLGILFHRSKQLVQKEAFSNATQILNETVNHISNIMDSVELVTAEMELTISSKLEPDSMLVWSRRMLEQHPHILGFTIAMEPDYFPEQGRNFSAYSLRQGDSIQTVVERHNYHELVWYKTAWEQKRACWLEPYKDNSEVALSSNEYNFSYTKPLYDADGQPVGILCTDILLKWLSQAVTAIKPYPNSSAIMLGQEGRYIVHPDTAKLVHQTIFSDPDPQARQDIIPLGHSMLAGNSGMQQLVVGGQDAHVFYCPLERTGWSIAIVCPDSDVFAGYSQMLYTVRAVIGLSMILLLLFIYQIVRRAIVPINNLAASAWRIAEGHFDETLPPSNRVDTVGRLQNSFVTMQQTLNNQVTQLRQINSTMEKQNEELQQANKMVHEADQRKTSFIQDMTHQIRTPLNIINGFTQVITTNHLDLPADEFRDIFGRMKSSAKAISRISRMLIASSVDLGQQLDDFSDFECNALCREAIAAVADRKPATANIVFESSVSDDFTLRSNRNSLYCMLVELLNNALRFAPVGTITVSCSADEGTAVVFTVSDNGPGIAPADRSRIFSRFTKLDSFSEGLGLGLTLINHTVHLLGGDLMLDESYCSGTRFVLKLPFLAS